MIKIIKKFFVLVMVILVSCTAFIACKNVVKGKGDMVDKSIEVGAFTRVDIKGSFKVVFKYADACNLKLSMQDNFYKYVDSKVENDTLKVYQDDRVEFSYDDSNIPTVNIFSPKLTYAEITACEQARDWERIVEDEFT